MTQLFFISRRVMIKRGKHWMRDYHSLLWGELRWRTLLSRLGSDERHRAHVKGPWRAHNTSTNSQYIVLVMSQKYLHNYTYLSWIVSLRSLIVYIVVFLVGDMLLWLGSVGRMNVAFKCPHRFDPLQVMLVKFSLMKCLDHICPFKWPFLVQNCHS